MVVMPSLAERNEREHKTVLAVIAGFESSLTYNVCHRIDAESSVVQKRCADAETPCEHLKWSGTESWKVSFEIIAQSRESGAQYNGWYDVMFVQKAKFRKFDQILNVLPTSFYELSAEYPSHMRPPEAVNSWWMYILFGVRELVMMTVMRCPPDRPFLRGGRSDEGQNELKPTACLVASVREVSVIDTRDAEHPYDIERHTYRKGCPAEAGPEYEKASEMNSPESSLFYQVSWVKWIPACAHVYFLFSNSKRSAAGEVLKRRTISDNSSLNGRASKGN